MSEEFKNYIGLKVEKYDSNTFFDILVNNPPNISRNRELIKKNYHHIYFQQYLRHFINNNSTESVDKPITIVIEENYIDQHFDEDRLLYYAIEGTLPNKECTRVHLFNLDFDRDEFIKFMESAKYTTDKLNIEKLQNNYLGFIVLKPLKESIIGKTCLKTYDSHYIKNDIEYKRVYIKNKIDVNFFGINLFVYTTPKMEQDKVVSVCATSALWSVFHATGKIFQHRFPSPSQITKIAKLLTPKLVEPLPSPSSNKLIINLQYGINYSDINNIKVKNMLLNNEVLDYFSITKRNNKVKDLSTKEIKKVINHFKLSFHIGNFSGATFNNSDYLKFFTYIYLMAEIPFLLTGKVKNNTTGESKGKHAVAVTGFNISKKYSKLSIVKKNDDGIILKASAIDKIYIHDDQVGPFAYTQFIIGEDKLSSPWLDTNGNENCYNFEFEEAIVPILNEINVESIIAYTHLHKINKILTVLINNSNFTNLKNEIIWDFYLTPSNKLKNYFIENLNLIENQNHLLRKSLPKYIWRAIAYDNDKPMFELIFNSTIDNDNSGKISLLNIGIEYKSHNYIFAEILSICKNYNPKTNSDNPFENLLYWIKNRSKPDKFTFT